MLFSDKKLAATALMTMLSVFMAWQVYGQAGVAAPNVTVKARGEIFPGKGLSETGPVLVTHWGLSGPAILRLSAWGARALADAEYRFNLMVNWCPDISRIDQGRLL